MVYFASVLTHFQNFIGYILLPLRTPTKLKLMLSL